MSANNVFVLKRFAMYGRKLMVEQWKAEVLRALVMLAAIFIIFTWSGYATYTDIIKNKEDFTNLNVDLMWGNECVAFIVLLFLFGCYSASLMCENLKKRSGKIAVLTSPVSSFENWFSRWIIQVVMFAIMYIAFIIAGDYLRYFIYHAAYPEISHLIQPMPISYFIHNLSSAEMSLCSFVWIYLFTQSFYVLGSSFFPRHSALRTSLIMAFVVAIYILLDKYIVRNFNLGGNGLDSKGFDHPIIQSAIVFVTFFNWVVAYLRFKEMEVIDRF